MAHMEHFYVEPDDVKGERMLLRGGEFRHAVLVRRKKIGDSIAAVDGRGHLFRGFITDIQKGALQATITDIRAEFAEPKLRLTLAVACLKGAQMDWIVEKGTEIGIAVFQPITTARSMARADERLLRLRDKALAAMKQCGRSRCVEIKPVLPVAKLLADWHGKTVIIAHDRPTRQQEALKQRLQVASEALLVIGPEGGFTEEEVEAAESNGALLLYLGPRRLRSETAALVAAARLLTLAGEMG